MVTLMVWVKGPQTPKAQQDFVMRQLDLVPHTKPPHETFIIKLALPCPRRGLKRLQAAPNLISYQGFNKCLGRGDVITVQLLAPIPSRSNTSTFSQIAAVFIVIGTSAKELINLNPPVRESLHLKKSWH